MAPKKKQEKMALGDFLTNQSLGSWADEMDSVPLPSAPSGYGSSSANRDRDRDGGQERRSFTQPAWDQARSGSNMDGRGASYDRPRFEREQLPLPTKPPYTAHLGNLSYEVTQVDVEAFFEGCELTSVRIVEDKMDRKPKGFGYVEFGTLDGLKKALTLTESNFGGRNIKISVAEPPKDRGGDSNRDLSDWSRKGPLPELPRNDRQPSRGQSGFFAEDNKNRDFGNWERKGPLSPVPNAGPPLRDGGRVREGGGPPRERRASPSWGEGRSDTGSRPPREGRAPVERVPTAAEQDNQWRARMRPDPSPAATPDVSTPASPTQQAPKERPRLNLSKRTVSTVDPDAPSPAGGDSKASPFGAARPIDTSQREREVEEKRELAVRQKKEAEDKARDDKAAKDATSRAERAERADRGQADEEKVTSPTGGPNRGNRRPSRQQQGGGKQGAPRENGEGSQQQRSSFNILSREGEGDDAANAEAAEGARDAVDAPANGEIVGDKEVKPREVQVTKGSADTSTAEAMDDDGWSTVATKSKNKGRGGARAMAS